MLNIGQQGTDVLLDVKVVPKSSRDRIAGELDGALKVTVAAAPERGAANEAVRKLIAQSLGIRVQQVTIESGHANPRKTLRIAGTTAQAVQDLVKCRYRGPGPVVMPTDRSAT
ncbi:MAG: DUF167 domain-containing protein [Planctomycetes bacterium]|nr:DUF167 domain-containing protein [Planctomycetota bacterium]